MKGFPTTLALSLALLLGASAVVAEEYIYGRELMTEQELADHRAMMQSFKTEQEREAYRMAHHERMQQRAGEVGVQLPDEAPAAGARDGSGRPDSMHSGQGMGGGMGQGRDRP